MTGSIAFIQLGILSLGYQRTNMLHMLMSQQMIEEIERLLQAGLILSGPDDQIHRMDISHVVCAYFP